MDNALQIQITLVVFMLFLCMLCFFAVAIILRDIIRENSQSRSEPKESQPQKIEDSILDEKKDNPIKK